ncbi:MAG: NAD(P)/FAD-dependent oxidoreductase, partial [Candidatus Puniceispirillales bacterium]
LVLATGARARPLPGVEGEPAGLYTLRGLADIDAMRDEFSAGRRLLVIGGGYIGLEAASIARKLGLEVTVIEAAPRILGRVASPATADHIRNLHQKHGAVIREGIGVEKILTDGGRVTGALMADGTTEEADFIIAGIGIIANDTLAAEAGLDCDQGIVVDACCRTSDPAIYAAGDCTRFDYRGEPTRLESVGNAINQGEIVAANLAGEETPYQPKPWFWSDQYDLTLQIAGFNRGYDDTVTRPGAKEGSVSIWYYAGDELIAVDAMGDPRAYMIGKRLIEAGKSLPREVAADAEANLKEWL